MSSGSTRYGRARYRITSVYLALMVSLTFLAVIFDWTW